MHSHFGFLIQKLIRYGSRSRLLMHSHFGFLIQKLIRYGSRSHWLRHFGSHWLTLMH